jgi:hypothetical protein
VPASRSLNLRPHLKTAKPIRPSALDQVAAKRIFELHDISAHLDSTGFYRPPFQREFPLSLRAFRYRANRFTQGATWGRETCWLWTTKSFITWWIIPTWIPASSW